RRVLARLPQVDVPGAGVVDLVAAVRIDDRLIVSVIAPAFRVDSFRRPPAPSGPRGGLFFVAQRLPAPVHRVGAAPSQVLRAIGGEVQVQAARCAGGAFVAQWRPRAYGLAPRHLCVLSVRVERDEFLAVAAAADAVPDPYFTLIRIAAD